MRGIARDCMAELRDRKMIWLFAVVTLLGLLAVLGMFAVQNSAEEKFGEGYDDELTTTIGDAYSWVIKWFMYFMVFLAVMATAGEFPGMLQRGRADFYLSKPVSRERLYVAKLLGVWFVYGGAVTIAAVFLFLVASVLSGSLDWSIVYTIGMNLLIFLVWLTITGFFGILSRSTVTAIMMAFVVWLIQTGLAAREVPVQFIGALLGLDSIKTLAAIGDGLYYVFPKPSQMFDMIGLLADGRVETWLPLWSSLLFAAVLTLATLVVFRRKDY